MRSHSQEVRGITQVVRHLGGEGDESRRGMPDAQPKGVEQGPVKLQAVALRTREEARPSVARIARERQSDRGEMDPHLVRPPRPRKGGDERASSEPLQYPVSGLRRLSRRIDTP